MVLNAQFAASGVLRQRCALRPKYIVFMRCATARRILLFIVNYIRSNAAACFSYAPGAVMPWTLRLNLRRLASSIRL
jgi:hypothetical protein